MTSALLCLFFLFQFSNAHFGCDHDTSDKFFVKDTLGNSMRSCKWAERLNTKKRCKMEGVSENCPVTCNVPCSADGGINNTLEDGSGDDTGGVMGDDESGDDTGGVIAGAQAAPVEEDDGLPQTAIVLGALIAAVALITLMCVYAGWRGEREDSEEESGQEDDDGDTSRKSSLQLDLDDEDCLGLSETSSPRRSTEAWDSGNNLGILNRTDMDPAPAILSVSTEESVLLSPLETIPVTDEDDKSTSSLFDKMCDPC